MSWDRAPVCSVLVAVAIVSAVCQPYAKRSGRNGYEPATAHSVRPSAVDPQAQVCVVEGDSLRMLRVMRSPAGDTLVNGLPFRNVHPISNPPYIAGAGWYENHEPIRLGERDYATNHPPQVIAPELLRFMARYRGVPVFRAVDEDVKRPSYVYLPVRPGCVFQPFSIVSRY